MLLDTYTASDTYTFSDPKKGKENCKINLFFFREFLTKYIIQNGTEIQVSVF